MKSFRARLLQQALPFLLVLPATAYAQQTQLPTAAEAAAALNPAPSFTQAQLDQMLAPIALYPDQLLMQLLMAATFPQQVVAAGQWLQDPNNTALKGDALANALAPLAWDPSIKSLVAFPQIIAMMNAHFDWTEQLGLAFANGQVAVMAQVQFLRNRAAAAGTLVTNTQIRVVHQGPVIVIDPINPNEIYVPVYNPAVVYGTWPYNAYPPVYLPPPAGFVSPGFVLGAAIGFSVGYGIVQPLWGWGHPDWQRHEMVIDPGRYDRITKTADITGNHIRIQNNTWHRTAPVAPVAGASRPHPAAGNATHPPGTIAPAAIRTPAARPGAPAGRAVPAARPGTPEHPAARPEERAAPAAHPAPVARPEERTAPAAHPAPVARPEERAAPAARPEERAAPAARPVEHAAPAARPVEHAAPHPEARPVEHAAPAARPVEHAAPHPEARPVEHAAPHPEARPVEHAAPAARPVEHAAPHPEARPVEHAAPHPEARPAAPAHPAAKPEEKKEPEH